MSAKVLIITLVLAALGVTGVLLFLTAGEGQTVYVRGDAALARERGEHLLNKRRHTTDKVKKAEYLSQAIAEFEKALAIKPDFEVAYNMLGHAHIEQGQWELALKNLNKAIELRSDYPAALYNRAEVYKRLSVGKRDSEFLDKAITDYQAAMQSELAANFIGDIHKALADAYHQKGELSKAIEELKRYLQKAPHSPDAALVRRKIRGLQLMEQGSAPPLTAPLE
jgi:tetratricopeptide (TPR) repeat protein